MFELNSMISSNNENGQMQQQQQYIFNPNKRKSPFDQNDVYQMQDSDSKRMAIGSMNITTSTSSMVTTGVGNNTRTTHQLLACQNPMLASMLAKTPTSLPEEKIQTIPPSMISSTPDVKLPPNLDKKIIPTPPTTGANTNQSSQMHQTHPNQHLNNLMQPQQQIQHIQLQIQQQQHHIAQQHAQQQQHLITTIGPGSSTSMTPIAIKSGQQQQQIHYTNQSQLQQQIKQQQQVSNNYQ
ncbi:hypothetical protein BLA29_006319 [Euroglyphus maynei]|uniref:Uncharacterized protein n=1 Tax=Euroglyphus maynei TaxID=6958 RepID=A0A1Y3B8G3_EURMA|nr:hypothetical protein BLA29_006319 [Euroglyphus maynei]